MSEKKYTEVVEAMCVLDRQKSMFERNISYISTWLHRSHYGTMFLSKKEEESKNEIILNVLNYLYKPINELNENISLKVKEIEKNIFALFDDGGHQERSLRRQISVTCETFIKAQLEILAKSSSLGDKSADIRTALNNIQKIIREY